MSKIQIQTIGSIDGAYEIDVKDIQPIGVGQTWQDMTSQRELDVEYTNDTGRSIQVSVSLRYNQTSVGGSNIVVDGVNISYTRFETSATVALYIPFSFIVPAGSTYSIVSGGIVEVTRWAELRS